MLVNGSGMTLHLPTGPHVLRRDEPFAFDGGLAVRCTVDEPTLDLNVMTRRGLAVGGLEVRHLSEGHGPLVVPGAATAVLVVLDGAAHVLGVDDGPLESGDVAVTDEPLTISGHGRLAIVTID
jgi:environmental stress-induced protein Ves